MMPDVDLEPHEFSSSTDARRPASRWMRFKTWMVGTPEQLAHEKKAWGRIGAAVLLGLAFLWARYHH